MSSGMSASGSSGSVSIETGASQKGAGGDVTIAVGDGSKGAGGRVRIVGGSTLDASSSGGEVSVVAGAGLSTVGNVAVVGGALAGAALGGVMQDKLSQKAGYEYIIKVDTSKLKSKYYEGNTAMRNAISAATTSGVVTIVQGTDTMLKTGQKVYVIFSDDRTRVIPAS